MIFLKLFWEFFKTGLFAVGGGMATFPFLARMGQATGWFGAAQLADMVAVSESTPGPIGVNMATYVGYLVGGIPGAVVATLGLVTPSLIIILVISGFLEKFRTNRTVEAAFAGLRPASTGLIAAAGVGVVEIALFAGGAVRLDALILAAALLLLTNLKPLKKLHPVLFILLAAAAGIVFRMGGV